jgi:Domain of unknown function (DUF5069)
MMVLTPVSGAATTSGPPGEGLRAAPALTTFCGKVLCSVLVQEGTMHTIDLRTTEPRSAHEQLGGVKLLARVIDKGRAAIGGTLGPYRFFDCRLDRVFFEAINVSRNDFLDVLRRAYISRVSYNATALADLRESLECEPEVTDECFLAYAEARDADNAVVRWLLDQRCTPANVLATINETVNRLPPEAFIDWANDVGSLAGENGMTAIDDALYGR